MSTCDHIYKHIPEQHQYVLVHTARARIQEGRNKKNPYLTFFGVITLNTHIVLFGLADNQLIFMKLAVASHTAPYD